MHLSKRDGRGFLLTAVIATAPLILATAAGESLSKDGPIGLPAYILPTLVGLIGSIPFGIIARAIGRGTQEEVFCYVMAGVLAGFALLISFCVWWGAWSFDFAERFRSYPG